MAEVLNKGTLFPPALVKEIISKVNGKSSLVKLSNSTPISFDGTEEFMFTMDNEVDFVGESEKKSHGGINLLPIIMTPIKVEYGARVSEEFMTASEERQIEILEAFTEGFGKKLGKGLDIGAMHGLNPRTMTASTKVGNNSFDGKVTQKVTYEAANINSLIETAIGMVEGSEGTVTGICISPTCRQALAALKNSAEEPLYPELKWGGNPGSINGLKSDSNITVSLGNKDHAIVGNFEEMFKWGYAKDIKFKTIEYGDPDGTGKDLQAYGQVYLRAEAYIGWGIFDPESFARVEIAA